MDKQIIELDLERYEELIKKEAVLDKLLEESELSIYLTKKNGGY